MFTVKPLEFTKYYHNIIIVFIIRAILLIYNNISFCLLLSIISIID